MKAGEVRAAVWGGMSTLVGGLVLARLIPERQTSDAILRAARQAALQILTAHPSEDV